jgi:hypothetical protein
MGATAAQAMLGKDFKVTQQRGHPIMDSTWAPCVIATVHPSSLLRIPDHDERVRALRQFEDDLKAVRRHVDQLKRSGKRPSQSSHRVPNKRDVSKLGPDNQSIKKGIRATRHQ